MTQNSWSIQIYNYSFSCETQLENQKQPANQLLRKLRNLKNDELIVDTIVIFQIDAEYIGLKPSRFRFTQN